ncbi:MAG: PorV/PorQ family protein [candidate division KSB1 bacterium]|nr:PorV/PorQ family protein [candidate division KSB1 bacterium]
MQRKLSVLLLFIIVCPVFGQSLLPELGEQRAGTSAMTYLKIGVGARAVSMGGAFVAMSNDASSLYWNPAGLVQVNSNEIMVSHTDWLLDVDSEYLGYVHQVNSNIALGAFVGYLHLADMPVTTEYHPYGNGEYFSYYDMMTGLGVSIRMTDRFSFGISGKYVREQLDDLVMDGILFDFGTYYWTGYKTLRLAACMRNFGNDLRPAGSYERREKIGTSESSYEAFSPPTIFSLGVAMDVYSVGEHTFTGSFQMDHPMDDAENYVIGVEYQAFEHFNLRSGYLSNSDSNNWTFGAGFRVTVFGKTAKIDYSYADYTYLSSTQQFTFRFEL